MKEFPTRYFAYWVIPQFTSIMAISPAEDKFYSVKVCGRTKQEAKVRAIRKCRKKYGSIWEDRCPFSGLVLELNMTLWYYERL